jgi:uncharacterized protein YbjT (DUF2867 family)
MAGSRYRSYVVRVWSGPGGNNVARRTVVEEVLSGRQADLRDGPAADLAATLEASVGGRMKVVDAEAEPTGGSAMVLVVGATGMVGGEICRRLAAQGTPVRALVRTSSDPAKVEALKALGAEVVVGDLRDGSSLGAACAGMDAVITTAAAIPFTYVPGVNDIQIVDLDGTKRLIDAARAASVRHFTYTSFSGNLDLEFPLRNAKREVEQYLRESGLDYTILRPSCFMEVWLSPAVGFDPAAAKATIYGEGTAPISYIAIADLAEFAVRSLTAPAARNATLEMGGPVPVSQVDAVRIFERVGGRVFEVQHVPEEALLAQRAAATDPMALSFATLMRCVAGGDAIEMTSLLSDIPVPLTTVEDYAARVLGRTPAGVA